VLSIVHKCTRRLIHKIFIHGDELLNGIINFTLK
jgi:hypothetical protein